jgi:broad specificity phosphatase PhoE
MARRFYFLSHPNVAIDPGVPVTQWPLSELGRVRMRAGLALPWIPSVTAIYSSTEQKAIDAATILGEHLSVPVVQLARLGENDRSSTGFLAPTEFEAMASEFFARPTESVRGWERALDAQQRIVQAVQTIAATDRTLGAIAIVSHGAVGTLLHSSMAGNPISRRWDQPPNGGGNYYAFEVEPPKVLGWWSAIDAGAA